MQHSLFGSLICASTALAPQPCAKQYSRCKVRTWCLFRAATQVLRVLPRARRLLPGTGWLRSGHSGPARLSWSSSCLHRYTSQPYFVEPSHMHKLYVRYMHFCWDGWVTIRCTTMHAAVVRMCFQLTPWRQLSARVLWFDMTGCL